MTDRLAYSASSFVDPHAGTPCRCPVVTAVVLLVIDAIPETLDQDPLPGIGALLDHLTSEGIPCLVVTAARRPDLLRLLSAAACAMRLPMCICREDVANPLPHPAALLLATQRLALPPRHALVIANGPEGIAAARKAGCAAVGLTGIYTTEELLAAGAQQCTARLDALLPLSAWIERRFSYSSNIAATPPRTMQAGAR